MARKFSCKFLLDVFSNKNIIITRISDGYVWRVDLSNCLLHDNKGYKIINDETISQFFDEKNEFKSNEYDLTYRDFYKEWRDNELRKNGAKWLNEMINEMIDSKGFSKTAEQILKQIMGV